MFKKYYLVVFETEGVKFSCTTDAGWWPTNFIALSREVMDRVEKDFPDHTVTIVDIKRLK